MATHSPVVSTIPAFPLGLHPGQELPGPGGQLTKLRHFGYALRDLWNDSNLWEGRDRTDEVDQVPRAGLPAHDDHPD